MYDLTVFYRLTDIPSTNPSPVYQHDKQRLNLLCLRSFVEAYKDVNMKMVFICDYCDETYKFLIGDIFHGDKDIHFTKIGINETCLMQYKLASETEGRILFQECDYVYRFGTGKLMVSGIDNLSLVSPYDHKNFYVDKTIHSENCKIRLVNDTHWRTTERNTMTFGTTSDIVKKHYDTFIKYGYLDNEVWRDLRGAGLPLWVPIPSFATHMVEEWMAPSVNWEAILMAQGAEMEKNMWFASNYE